MKGGWIYNGGDWEFLKSLHSWQRSANPLFYEEPHPPLRPYCLTPFSNFVLHPNFPVTSNIHPHCFFSCLVSFAEWVITAHFTYWQLVPDLSTRRTLMCFMQKGIKFTEVWHIMWLFTGTLIWYQTHRQTQTHTHSTLRDQ